MLHDRKGYKLRATPLATGGQAELFAAKAKATSELVVLKRCTGAGAHERARMRREIDVQRVLSARSRHVMPILDWDLSGGWYVMPFATRSLEKLATPIDDDTLRDVVSSVLAALEVAHVLGHAHRDIKPANILLLEDAGKSRWVLGDWGVARRALGKTTTALTRVGYLVGTDGYAAPEAYRDAHALGPQADLYSLGQTIGWALTGQDPIPNVAPSVRGRWRTVVRRLTQVRPEDRFGSCAEVQAAVDDLFNSPATLEASVRELAEGDVASAVRACLLALQIEDNGDLLLDVVAEVDGVATVLVRKYPSEALALVEAMVEALGSFGHRDFNYANVPLRFMHDIAVAAAKERNYELLADCCAASFPAEVSWDRYRQRDVTVAWLENLRGEAARVVADCVAGVPRMNKYLRASELGGSVGATLRGAGLSTSS